MKIDVIMVCFNSRNTIKRAIESYLAQRHASKSLIIVDGGSTDGTQTIIGSFDRSDIRVVSEKDEGIYDAMNKGLRLFDGDAVGFLNSDDTFHSPDCLGAIDEALTAADIVYGDLLAVSDQETKRVIRVWKAGDYPASGFHNGWVPPHGTVYLRKAVADKIGGYNLKYRLASDYDFMLRAFTLPGVRIRYVPTFLVDYRLGGASSNSIRSIIRGNLECLDSRRRNLGHPFVDYALISRPARRVVQLLRAAVNRDAARTS